MSYVQELEQIMIEIPNKILSIKNVDNKPTPEKWSKKEILGHLCDSATMNHKRFIERIISKDEISLELYKQNHWVEFNDYQNSYSMEEVLILWTALNKRIVNLLKNLSEDQWNLQYSVNEEKKVTLDWLFGDYIDHMKHHFRQIFPS